MIEDKTMIVYRATTVEEDAPLQREYEGVYFTTTFPSAAYYLYAHQSGMEEDEGFIQKYRIEDQVVLRHESKEMQEIADRFFGSKTDIESSPELQWDPPEGWIALLRSLGYTAMQRGDEVLVFDEPTDSKLLSRWWVWREGPEGQGGRWRKRRLEDKR